MRVTNCLQKFWRRFRRFEREVRGIAAFLTALKEIAAGLLAVFVFFHLVSQHVGYLPLLPMTDPGIFVI